VFALLSVSVITSTGCVGLGTHNGVVADRDGLIRQKNQLETRVRNLETSNDALQEELTTTLEQYEDLSIEREGLEKRVDHLEITETVLSQELGTKTRTLEDTEAALAAARLEVARLGQTYDSLVEDLESELSAGQIEIEQLREGIRLNLSDDILFASGSAQLDPIGQKVLQKVIDRLLTLNHMIEVQGHTDDRKISRRLAKRFPTNWDLAAARAARVVRLMESSGIEGASLSAVSYASFQPIASNDTPEDRSLNRRIEIRLLPRRGAAPAPGAGSEEGESSAQAEQEGAAQAPSTAAAAGASPVAAESSPPTAPNPSPRDSASNAASVSAALATAGEASPRGAEAERAATSEAP
jgi:chemotaxis protein MotB